MKGFVYSAVLMFYYIIASNNIFSQNTAAKLNLNNISTWIYNNGDSDKSPDWRGGFIFPRGSGRTAIFESGLVWGAKIDDKIHIGGSTYNHGLQSGKILASGIAENKNLEKNRVYRVRPDYKTADFSIEEFEENKSKNEVFLQYEKDWNEWPAEDGAPFEDINGNGEYDPESDIPGIKNAIQTIWFVSNDLDSLLTMGLYGSKPMGIELQAVFWAFDRNQVLSNSYFRKYKMINKSSSLFKDMYISMWSAPELGDPYDNYAGCDTVLGLGYAYNADQTDVYYWENPPAAGFDFLQGPITKLNAMTAFNYFTNGSLTDPPLNNYDGSIQMYYSMQGKNWSTGELFRDPQGKPTSYALSGDPVSGQGWLDGQIQSKGDRRILMSSGPFDMAPRDTQEVAIVQIAAMGDNRLHSVWLLKQYAKILKQYYDRSFDIMDTKAPEAPQATARYIKNEIVIEWPADTIVENFSEGGFRFEGYNVYQLPDGIADKKNALKLSIFDKKNGITDISGEYLDTLAFELTVKKLQSGSDSGIERLYSISRDSLGQSGLYRGKEYFFAVSAYTYREDPAGRLTFSESPLKPVSVVFQDIIPGFKYLDTIRIVRVSGSSDNMITAVVYDPSKLTGYEYEVGFLSTSSKLTSYLKNLTLNKYLTWDLRNASDSLFDGIRISMDDAVSGMKAYQIPTGERKWTWISAHTFNLEGFNGAIGNAYTNWFTSSSISPKALPNTLIKFASTDSKGNITDPNDPNASYAYRYLRRASDPAARPEFQQYIKNASPGYAYQDFTLSLPFAAFNAETGQRLSVGYLEHNYEGGRVDGKYWPPSSDEGVDNVSSSGPREWFFIFNTPYSKFPYTELQTDILSNTTPMLWFGTPNRRGASDVVFSKNDQFLIIKSNPFSVADKFTFNTGNITTFSSKHVPAKYELKQNFPNPFNSGTRIQFSLAERGMVTLSVYNILGQVVRELINGEFDAGVHNVEFHVKGLSAGVYIYRLGVKEGYSELKKMTLLK